jgi:hypothetical protein
MGIFSSPSPSASLSDLLMLRAQPALMVGGDWRFAVQDFSFLYLAVLSLA